MNDGCPGRWARALGGVVMGHERDELGNVVTRICIQGDDNLAQMLALVANAASSMALELELLRERVDRQASRIAVLEAKRRRR